MKAKRDHNFKLIFIVMINSLRLWTTVNNFLHRNFSPVLPSYECLESLSQSFATFFFEKIHKRHINRLLKTNDYSPHIDLPSHPVTLANFQPVALDEVSGLAS
jgi:hypothetical protein